MTTKHEIEMPDLPEGWRAVAYRIGNIDECCLDPKTGQILKLFLTSDVHVLIVEKIKPRRIVLEDTQGDMPVDEDRTDWIYHSDKWWRIVEEE